MSFTTLLSAVVRFAHQLLHRDRRGQTVLPSPPIAPCLALADDEVEELAEAV